MADKEIIDGVDVSECQNYNLKTKKCTIPCRIGYIKCTGLTCSDIKDCYFKQLKQAEQKLNKIKNRCIEYMEVFKMQGVDPKGGGYDHILQIIKGEENE